MAKPTHTFTVRLTEGNKAHERALEIMEAWLAHDQKAQTILVKALLALGQQEVEPSTPVELAAIERLFELESRLEKAINKLNSFKGMVSAADVQKSVQEELDLGDDFLSSVASQFNTTNG